MNHFSPLNLPPDDARPIDSGHVNDGLKVQTRAAKADKKDAFIRMICLQSANNCALALRGV